MYPYPLSRLMRAGVLAIIAGVLLLFSGAGSSTLLYDAMADFVIEYFPSAEGVVDWILRGLSFLAGLGGLAIIAGGILMLMGLEGTGRLVTVIAAIAALVGFVVLLIVLGFQGEGEGGWWVDLSLLLTLIGIILAFRAKPLTS